MPVLVEFFATYEETFHFLKFYVGRYMNGRQKLISN